MQAVKQAEVESEQLAALERKQAMRDARIQVRNESQARLPLLHPPSPSITTLHVHPGGHASSSCMPAGRPVCFVQATAIETALRHPPDHPSAIPPSQEFEAIKEAEHKERVMAAAEAEAHRRARIKAAAEAEEALREAARRKVEAVEDRVVSVMHVRVAPCPGSV